VGFEVLSIQSRTISKRVEGSAYTGCGKSLPEGQVVGGVYNVSISSSGIERSYLAFIPPAYNVNVPTPLILSYHGGNRNASQQLTLDELTSPEFNMASMVIYPQGINVCFL
jgi:poly(3-hydroxybutyrate) depolymerase